MENTDLQSSGLSMHSVSGLASDVQLILEEEDVQEDPDDAKYRLPFFMSSLFATILEDCITQMRVLVGCNTELNLAKCRVDHNHLIAIKFAIKQPEHTDELDGIDARILDCDQYKINKLDVDRKIVSNTFVATYLDMSLRRCYKHLAIRADSMWNVVRYHPALIEDEAKNRLTRRELGRQLRQFRNHIKSVYYDTDHIIEELKSSVEDSSLNAEIRSRYVEGWQRARTEQHRETIRLKEAKPLGSIDYHKQRCDHEHRVHTEIETLVTIVINETLAKVESWMNKYDQDMEAVDLKIQIMKNKYVAMVEKREGLEKTIAKHAELIKSWVDFKDARQKAREYHDKMTNAAIVVQAWWRGLLVRNQLGPYKPPPKKKGAAADKKKK